MDRSPDGLQMDLLTAIVRIEQVATISSEPMRAILLDRLSTCDAPRLRRHLTRETLAWEAEWEAEHA